MKGYPEHCHLKGSGKPGIQEVEAEVQFCWQVVRPREDPDCLHRASSCTTEAPDCSLGSKGSGGFTEQGSEDRGDKLTKNHREKS